MSLAQTLPLKPSREDILRAMFSLSTTAANHGQEDLANSIAIAFAAISQGKLEHLKTLGEDTSEEGIEEVRKLPLLSIDQLQTKYRDFAQQVHESRFSFRLWLPSLDVPPLVPGELAIVLADTGVGKSQFLANWAVHAGPMLCLKFELELPATKLFERYVGMDTGLTGSDVFDLYHKDNGAGFNAKRFSHIWTCEKSGITPEEIENIILKCPGKIGGQPVMVFVDYIGLIGGKGGTRYERVSNAIERFKTVAKNTGTIFVVAAQVSRPDDKETVQDPKLHSAKDSGSLENSGGLVLGLSRETGTGGNLKVKVLKCSDKGGGLIVNCDYLFPSKLIVEHQQPIITNPKWRATDAPATAND